MKLIWHYYSLWSSQDTQQIHVLYSLFTRIYHSVEIVNNPDILLTWPTNRPQTLSEEKEKEESPKPTTTGATEQIQLHPLGPVAVPLEQETNVNEDDELITTKGTTSSRSERLEDCTEVYQLQCGNTICNFKLALYQFVWKPKVTYAPPRPPSSSSESESSTTVEERDKEQRIEIDQESLVKVLETSRKESLRPKFTKVENTEANV